MSKSSKPKIHPKYFVPNAFTALSMLFGLASMVTAATGNFTLAAWMILWGVLLDKLDGTSARVLNASSDFGMEFDSFADFVVFGIAPAALVYFRLLETMTETRKLFLLLACGIFVVATAMRLCRFNISEPPGGDKIFYGIPTTLCGAFVASAFLTWEKYLSAHPDFLRVLPAALVVCGVAMVSSIKLPKLKPRKNVPFNIFQVVNIVAVYSCTAMMLFPEYMFGLLILYVGIGSIWAILHPLDLSEYEDRDGDDEPETPVATA